jgi:hypothetical protein
MEETVSPAARRVSLTHHVHRLADAGGTAMLGKFELTIEGA